MNHPTEQHIVGLRFRPTEQEIISYYLQRKMCGLGFPFQTINEVDICKFEPWELPEHSPWPEENKAWYFFSALVYKYPNSKRIDRTTNTGFWKLTGRERTILDKEGKEIGFRKILVFHEGRVPNGIRTNWVMHEYNSHNVDSYQKKYVLYRLKRKSNGGSDACNEPSRHLASNFGNHVTNQTTNPQTNNDLSEELKVLLSNTAVDDEPFSQLLSWIPLEQRSGTLFSNGFNNEVNMLNSGFDTIEQVDAFVNSMLTDQDECSGERRIHARRDGFNPTKSLRGVYDGDSSDTDTEIVYEQSYQVLQSASLFDGNTSSEEYLHVPMVGPPIGTSSSSDGGDNDFLYDVMVDSDTDMPAAINCLDFFVDEFPTTTRTFKTQHTLKSHNVIEKKCAPQSIQLQADFSPKEVSKVKVKEAAKHVVDLPRKENSIVKLGKDKKVAQTNAKVSLKSRSNRSDNSNGKGALISQVTKTTKHNANANPNANPPSVYLGNVLLSMLLIILILWEMMSVH